ncbi:MAG: AI-2E family transporter [Xanthomonadales bacterium]|nr:AI-2E family transporter [Xanthomonadales bacterium]
MPALRLLIGLAIAAIVIAALYLGRALLIPIALAVFFGFLLDPAVRRLHRWRLPRAIAVFLVVFVALGALVGVGVFVTSQVTGLSEDLPAYQSTITRKLHALRQAASKPGAWDGMFRTLERVQKEIEPALPGGSATTAPPTKVEIVGPEARPVGFVLDWLDRVSEPVATAGIALLFVILILLDRSNLRDRVLRLAGGDLHAATDAMDEASARIGRYLRMQFIINACYAVPMGLGLWWIGVPAAALWGVVAGLLRFVPYVGPIVSSVFPLALAFAVSPDWSMVLWTLALILTLELILNNAIEPWLYGASTGLSAMSIIVAAMFWTALWGPIGLILSTPLTVCLLVVGRYLPSLRFLEVLLGSESSLAPAERLYQRLLADDLEEAVELAGEFIDARRRDTAGDPAGSAALADYYDEVGIPALRLATSYHVEGASAEHRLRVATDMGELVAELGEQYPAPAATRDTRILCLGARWEVDVLAAQMAAHALAWQGWPASAAEVPAMVRAGGGVVAEPAGAGLVCLSLFGRRPQARIRLIARRLRRRDPDLRILVAAWNAAGELPDEDDLRRLGVDAVVTRLHELLLYVGHLAPAGGAAQPPPLPEDDAERVAALQASGALDPDVVPLLETSMRHAINAFDTRYATVSWVDENEVHRPAVLAGGPAGSVPRELAVCSHVVGTGAPVILPNVRRDPRFADNPMLRELGVGFYAGVPLRDAGGHVLGAFCIMDTEPRELAAADLAVLVEMAERLMESIRDWRKDEDGKGAEPAAP